MSAKSRRLSCHVRKQHILNSSSGYKCCALPRLGTKLGERDTKEKRQEVEEEERKKQELIKNLRKERQKARRNNRQPHSLRERDRGWTKNMIY